MTDNAKLIAEALAWAGAPGGIGARNLVYRLAQALAEAEARALKGSPPAPEPKKSECLSDHAAAEPEPTHEGGIRIDPGTGTHDFDEIVMPHVAVHLERMHHSSIWMSLETLDGHLWHVNFWPEKRTIHCRCEYQGKFPPRGSAIVPKGTASEEGDVGVQRVTSDLGGARNRDASCRRAARLLSAYGDAVSIGPKPVVPTDEVVPAQIADLIVGARVTKASRFRHLSLLLPFVLEPVIAILLPSVGRCRVQVAGVILLERPPSPIVKALVVVDAERHRIAVWWLEPRAGVSVLSYVMRLDLAKTLVVLDKARASANPFQVARRLDADGHPHPHRLGLAAPEGGAAHHHAAARRSLARSPARSMIRL